MYTDLICTEELARIINDPNLLVVDCRYELAHPEAGYKLYQNGHIPGAFFADLFKDMSSQPSPTTSRHPLPDPEAFNRLLSGWGLTPDIQVVVYDSENGALAAVRLWWLLRAYGHTAVAVLNGGYPKWTLEDRPTETGSPFQRKPSGFRYTYHPELSINADQVEQIRKNPDWLLVDARSSQRYLGLEELIDPVAGHIPGAVNLPHMSLVNSPNGFLSKADLKGIFTKLLGNHAPDHTVVYCGSGVTSIMLILAMETIGLHGVKLYAGSWSEWIRDPAHEIAVGNDPAEK
jgi:thiosulfate/3-mercaptopyruvate sulfurtransferase